MSQTQEDPLRTLRVMDPYDFEGFVAKVWERQGWETEVTQSSADRGIDIVATKSEPFPQKQLIQAKRYAEGNNVGSAEIQQSASLKQQEGGTDYVTVVTTSDFTAQAIELANSLNVKTINADSLLSIVTRTDSNDLISQGKTAVDIDTGRIDAPASETENDRSDEMGTGRAILATLRLLLLVGMFGLVSWTLLTAVVF